MSLVNYATYVRPKTPVHPLQLNLALGFSQERSLLRPIWQEPHGQQSKEHSGGALYDEEQTPVIDARMYILDAKCNETAESAVRDESVDWKRRNPTTVLTPPLQQSQTNKPYVVPFLASCTIMLVDVVSHDLIAAF